MDRKLHRKEPVAENSTQGKAVQTAVARDKWFLIVLILVWGCLCLLNLTVRQKDISVSERRKLEKRPQPGIGTIRDGTYMDNFEKAALDQFVMREQFRQIKAFSVFRLFGEKENNGIYLMDGYASKIDYPLNWKSLEYFTGVLQKLYGNHIAGSDSRVYFTMVPDKNYYMAEQNGYPSFDYAVMEEYLKRELDFAEHIDIKECLKKEDYYQTDTHWRQECLQDSAEKILTGMHANGSPATYRMQQVERPFYGVYYGQAAIRMRPDTICYLTNTILESCTVYHYETGKVTGIYDMEELDGYDPYEMFLSGADPLLEIQNPLATDNRELVVFRDSFAGSLVPLLVKDYRKLTLVDIRYINSSVLPEYLTFSGQDVLFMYSTLIINHSAVLK